MSRRVLAVALDSGDLPMLERLMAAGELPHLRSLVARSARWPLRIPEAYKAEAPWTTFATGHPNEETGYWSAVSFDPATYTVTMSGAADIQPFFALGDRASVIALDIPHAALGRDLCGVQVIGWGGHDLQFPRSSTPPGALRDLEAAVGVHPGRQIEYLGSWHQPAFVRAFGEALVTGASRRVEAVRHLMARVPDWNLCLVGVSELHNGAHQLWFGVDDRSPFAAGAAADAASEAMSAVLRAVDDSIGALVAAVPEGTTVVAFSIKGMEADTSDVAAAVLVPELLCREATGERHAVQPDAAAWRAAGCPPLMLLPNQSVPSYMAARFRATPAERRSMLAKATGRRLAARVAPDRVRRRDGEGGPIEPGDEPPFVEPDHASLGPLVQDMTPWSVATWYRDCWPRMRAFGLPSFSDPNVRLNIVGREANGLVAPCDYTAACDAVVRLVEACTDPCTGERLDVDVQRLRTADPLDPAAPPADLLVRFGRPLQAIEHPRHGLIGPFPHARTGGHTVDGFAFVAGPGIEPGDRALRPIEALPPTLLALLGLPTDGYAPPLDTWVA